MSDFLVMLIAIVAGSALSLLGGALIFLSKKRRKHAINMALPFGAGALLAAAFFDLLPESFELGNPQGLLAWALVGFLVFFLFERLAGWFHHHHEHDIDDHKRYGSQSTMLVVGDLMHNAIDGVAIGVAFLAGPATGVITVLAVSAHEIPKELGTFGVLISRGWRDRKVLIVNAMTAVGTIISASIVYLLGSSVHLPVAELLAITAGMFIYIASSDIIPDIHEQPKSVGTMQAVVLVGAVLLVYFVLSLLGV